MRFTISRKEKVKQFNDIIKKMQKVCPEVNFVFDTDGLYAQGMNSSHVIIFELKLKNDWFDQYECTRTSIMGVNCSILATVHNCIIEGQKVKWSYYPRHRLDRPTRCPLPDSVAAKSRLLRFGLLRSCQDHPRSRIRSTSSPCLGSTHPP